MSVSYKFNGVNMEALSAQFIASVAAGEPERALSYLKRGANINARNPDEDTALLHAVRTNDVPMTMMLIQNRASLDAQDVDGATALIIAARANNMMLCRALIDAGADISIEDRDGRKAFDHAMRTANPQLVELFTKPLKQILDRIPTGDLAQALRASQRNLDEIDPASGYTVLTWAASQRGQEGLAKAFIEAGADLQARNRDGKTPLDIARESGNSPMQRLLEEAQKTKPPVVMEKRPAAKPLFAGTST